MNFGASGGLRIKYSEDFSITIAAGNPSATYNLGQSINVDKTFLLFGGCRGVSSSPDSILSTLEFSGSSQIIARRSATSGETIVNGQIVEMY